MATEMVTCLSPIKHLAAAPIVFGNGADFPETPYMHQTAVVNKRAGGQACHYTL